MNLTISRKLALILVAAAAGAVIAIAGFSLLLRAAAASSAALLERTQTQATAALDLIDAVARVQDTSLKLVREKDIDALESLMNQNDAAGKGLQQLLKRSGLEGGPVGAAAAALEKATARGRAQVLAGEGAQAAQIFIEESTPAFQSLLDRIGALQAETNKAMDEEAGRARSRQLTIQTAVTAAVAALVALVMLLGAGMARGISRRLTDAVERIRAVAAGELRGEIPAAGGTRSASCSLRCARWSKSSGRSSGTSRSRPGTSLAGARNSVPTPGR